MGVPVRRLRPEDVEAAGALLYHACATAASARGYSAPWPGEQEAAAMLARDVDAEPAGAWVAEVGGAVVGVGVVRVRGEVATLAPIAVAADRRGLGTALVEALLERADDAGCAAVRACAPAWSPAAYALLSGQGFSVCDVAVAIERDASAPPRLESARGLEVRAATREDMAAIQRVDAALTGNDRPDDLGRLVRLVARRRGTVVGYLGAARAGGGVALGPAVAADAADLFTLVASALAAENVAGGAPVRARLSTVAPAAALAARAAGFHVCELGVVMSRGAPPPARPPQLYSLAPEIL